MIELRDFYRKKKTLEVDAPSILKKDKTLLEKEIRTPDFFIPGAAKSGTTSLFEYLGGHPSIFVPGQKEPGYFSACRPMQEPGHYAELFKRADPSQIIGEASTAYLPSPYSAERIAEVCPEAKIIIMLRNPADRAFSLYRHMVRYGQEPAPTFLRALKLEPQRRESGAFQQQNMAGFFNYMYFTSGLYYRQVSRFFSKFDESQFKIILFDEFVEDPLSKTQEIYRFLDLDDSFHPDTSIYNERQDIYSPRLQVLIAQYVRKLPSGLRFASILTRINKALFSFIEGKTKSSLDKNLRLRLLDCYTEDIKKTGDLINRDLGKYWLPD